MRKRYAHLIWRRRDPRHYRFPLPNAVWEYKLKSIEFVIFSYLCYCGAHGQAIGLTPAVVADGVHLSVDTTKKYLDSLVGRGLITTEGTLSPDAQHTSTEKFFTLPNEIFLLKLPPSAFMVYAYLLLIENRRTHNCHPSYNTIAAATGMVGRNRLVVGQLLEEDFVRLNVRYIAIMDNIDTANGVSDIVPMQDLFNEWHAKNTSDKVRRVMQSRGNAGIPLTTNPPFGYKKDPEDKNRWIVDEPAAEVVRRIFQMSISGLGPTQIAKRLKAEDVPTPSEYQRSIGLNCPARVPEFPHSWCSRTVADILDRQEYVGDTVNFRTYRQSFKQKKQLDRPQEDWKVFPNTHPAIIDRETFSLVQDLRQHRRRPTKSGIVSMFSGLLYCADCGEKLYYSCTNNYKREQAYFFCSSYRRNSKVCSAHYIRERVVEQLVLEGLQRLMWYIQVYEKQFAQEQMERFGLQEKKALTTKRRELDGSKQRVAEIDQLIQKSYEDMTKGLLSEERFATLTVSLENEQKQLRSSIPEMESSLNTAADKSTDLQHFIERARQVTRLTELTPEIVHEFIDKIVVSKPEKVDGKRRQTVDIYYNTVGLWVAPGPETLEKEYMAYYQTMKRRKKKTA